MVKAYHDFEDWLESRYGTSLASIKSPEDLQAALDNILSKERSRLGDKVKTSMFDYYKQHGNELTEYSSGRFKPINSYDRQGNNRGSSIIGEQIAKGQAILLQTRLGQLKRIKNSSQIDTFRSKVRKDDRNKLSDAYNFFEQQATKEQESWASEEAKIKSRIELNTLDLKEKQVEQAIQNAQYGQVTASFRRTVNDREEKISDISSRIKELQSSNIESERRRALALIVDRNQQQKELERVGKQEKVVEELIKINQARKEKKTEITVKGIKIPITKKTSSISYEVKVEGDTL